MSDATMPAIRVTEEHREKARKVLPAYSPKFAFRTVAAALAEHEAAVWEKAAEYLDAQFSLGGSLGASRHFRTQAAQIRGKE